MRINWTLLYLAELDCKYKMDRIHVDKCKKGMYENEYLNNTSDVFDLT